MTARLRSAPLACAILLSAASAGAQDRLYRLNPAGWALYSVTRSLPAVLAPDGTTVTPFLAGNVKRGSVGPPGYGRGGNQTGLYVVSGGLDEFSIFYKNLGGERGAHLCIDRYSTGYPVSQCLDFNGMTGTFTAVSQAIISYSIAPIGTDGWLRVSIIFKTAAALPADAQAFPYMQVNPSQRFALWRGLLITGKAP